jgi:hypothetical protein
MAKRKLTLATVVVVIAATGAAVLAMTNDEQASPVARAQPDDGEDTGGTGQRGCRTRTEGALPRDFLDESVVLGPVAFYQLKELAATLPAQARDRLGHTRYQPMKVIAAVRASSRVTVRVVEPVDGLALIYDLDTWRRDGTYRIEDGNVAVRFGACRATHPSFVNRNKTVGRWTTFNGGFIVAGPLCATLEARVRGRSTPIRQRVPFGTRCPSSPQVDDPEHRPNGTRDRLDNRVADSRPPPSPRSRTLSWTRHPRVQDIAHRACRALAYARTRRPGGNRPRIKRCERARPYRIAAPPNVRSVARGLPLPPRGRRLAFRLHVVVTTRTYRPPAVPRRHAASACSAEAGAAGAAGAAAEPRRAEVLAGSSPAYRYHGSCLAPIQLACRGDFTRAQ